ncbi:MAG TPA: hypothetical protein VGX25_15880 [Actinophytocola sp.]|uniref:hypothetical protein n=1 Tax=Actinophytocola sp. TaxID=1872138 RepID=UPI002DDC9FBF|nr:hypothetical protein [Actinophytocola sp.]HEV2780865.1 hypothetical protein [Actinophytocola sp.]
MSRSPDPNSPNYDPRMDPDSPAYDQTYDPDSPYYIDRRETSDSAGEVHDQAEREVTAHDEATDGGLLGLQDLIERFIRNGRIDEAYAERMSDQAHELAQDVRSRPAPEIPGANYLSYEHPQLKTMVTDAVDPGRVGEVGNLWIDAATRWCGSSPTSVGRSTTARPTGRARRPTRPGGS